jgi:hypothetical protein
MSGDAFPLFMQLQHPVSRNDMDCLRNIYAFRCGKELGVHVKEMHASQKHLLD